MLKVKIAFGFSILALGLVSVCSSQAEEPKGADDIFLTSRTLKSSSRRVKISDEQIAGLFTSNSSFKQQEAFSSVGLELPVERGTRHLKLVPHDIRSKNYIAQHTGAQGVIFDPTETILFKEATGEKNFARLAISQEPTGSVLRGFFKEGKDYYSVSSASETRNVVEVTKLNQSDVVAMIENCGAPKSQELIAAFEKSSASFSNSSAGPIQTFSQNSAFATFQELEVATDADFEYFNIFGTNTNAQILAILNSVDAIYRDQLGIAISVSFQNFWSNSSDPYTGSNAENILNQFAIFWDSNRSLVPAFDVFTLFSGKNFDGSVAGVAFVNSACSQASYSLVQNFSDQSLVVPVTAHEIGHTLGSEHDNCSSGQRFVMCDRLIGAVDEFSATSKANISNYLSTVSCLSTINTGGGTTTTTTTTTTTVTTVTTVSTIPPTTTTTTTTIPNAKPVLAPIGTKWVREDTLLAFNLSASDSDGDSLAFLALNLPSGSSFSGNRFSWNPNFNTVRNRSTQPFAVTFIVRDSRGAVDTEVVNVIVVNANRAPVLNPLSLQDRTIAEGSLFQHRITASDLDADRLTFSATNLPAGAILDSSGLLSWRPLGNQAGIYNITIKTTDTLGASTLGNLRIVVNNTPGIALPPVRITSHDISGDGLANLSLYRPGSQTWNSLARVNSQVNIVREIGTVGSVPVTGDFDGDGLSDEGVFDPVTSKWELLTSNTGIKLEYVLGSNNSTPAPADYDGDGRADIAVFQPQTTTYLIKNSSTSSVDSTQIGKRNDIPVPCDYNGDGKSELSLFNPITGIWSTKIGNSVATSQFGLNGDIPVPGDFNGDGRCDRAVWRPSNGNWYIQGQGILQHGLGGDIPLPLDFNGDGKSNLVVFRPLTGQWFLKDQSGTQIIKFGLTSDKPVASAAKYHAMSAFKPLTSGGLSGNSRSVKIYNRFSSSVRIEQDSGPSFRGLSAFPGETVLETDFNGDGVTELTKFSSGIWTITHESGFVENKFWGLFGDIPLSSDFDGDGITDLAIWRPSDGGWYVVRSSDGVFVFHQWGLPGDIPQAADFNGDGWDDFVVWRPASGTWFILDSRSGAPIRAQQWGLPGDVPRVADFDGDGKADVAVWRPSSGHWFWLASGSDSPVNILQWGLFGDVPIPLRFFEASETDVAVFRAQEGNVYIRSQDGTVEVFSMAPGGAGQLIGGNVALALG